jgi:alkylation response protein AidB-like acyl-CoA dehydrogenase
LFVPEAYTTWRDSVADRRNDAPLYSVSLITFYGLVFAGVSFGIARAALDDFNKLAREKRTGPGSLLRDNSVVQLGIARAEGQLGSARAYLAETLGVFWDMLCAGRTPSLEERARLRIGITHGIDNARAAVDFAYHAAGATAVFAANPFERRFRDMNTLTQQGQAHLSNLEDAGKALLGLNPGYRV